MGGEYSVAVVGLGDVGREIAERLVQTKIAGDKKISTLYLCSRDKEKARIFSENPLTALKGESEISAEPVTLDELLEANPNIVINCASVPKEKIVFHEGISPRRCMGIANLELNRQIIKKVPRDSLYLIVANHPLVLAEDSVITCKREPELTAGLTHTDTLRVRAAIETEIRKDPEYRKIPLDLSDVFVIGSHDENEMVLATACRVNEFFFRDIGILKGKEKEIEKAISEAGPVQMKHFKTTGPETSKAVEDVVTAAITGEGFVSAAVLSKPNNFSVLYSDFEVHEKFSRMEFEPMYLSVKTKFKDLAVDRKSGGVKELIVQPPEVLKKFYGVVEKQREFMNKLRSEGIIKGWVPKKVFPKPADKRNYGSTIDYITLVAAGNSVMAIGPEGIQEEKYVEAVRKVGINNGHLLLGFKRAVSIDSIRSRIFKFLDGEYNGVKGINSMLFEKGRVYATHSDLGLLVSEGETLIKKFAGPARSLTKIVHPASEEVLFISRDSIYSIDDLQNPVYKNDCEIIGMDAAFENMPCMVIADKSGKIKVLDKFKNYYYDIKVLDLGETIYCVKMYNDNRKVAFGTKEGIITYSPLHDTMTKIKWKKTRDLASKGETLVAAGTTSIFDVKKEVETPVNCANYHISSICVL
ncbi:hypothetical protein KY308_02450 [Candidatus Woesearchaeota archaeon]|nr:hypothetical protein [Candidatus Woesearchaeota archaeon]